MGRKKAKEESKNRKVIFKTLKYTDLNLIFFFKCYKSPDKDKGQTEKSCPLEYDFNFAVLPEHRLCASDVKGVETQSRLSLEAAGRAHVPRKIPLPLPLQGMMFTWVSPSSSPK